MRVAISEGRLQGVAADAQADPKRKLENELFARLRWIMCYGPKVLYGYTNLASRDELLRIVSLLAAKDRRDPVVTATAFDFTRLTDRNPVALPLSADKLLEQKIAYLHAMDAAARAESGKVSQFSGNVLGW